MGASTQEFAVPPGPGGPVITRSAISWRGDRSFDAGPAGRQHIIDILAKRKTPIEKLSVNVTAERRSDFPRRVMRLEVEFNLEGAGIEREHAERAIQLSFERYCSVASSLAPDIVIETRLALNGEANGTTRQKIWRPTI